MDFLKGDRMRRLLWPILLGSTLVIFTLHTQQSAVNRPDNNQFDKSVYQWSQTLAETIQQISTKYYQSVDPEKPMINAMSALVKTLDPHSSFMDPKEYKSILETTEGEFGGIGVIIDNTKDADDEYLRVIDTLPGEPADKAGIKPDDKIVQIDDAVVKGMTVEEASAKMRGKEGTTVHVKVLRNDSLHLTPFDIVRSRIKEQNALCYYFKNHNMYYLSLNMFTQNAIKQMEQLIKKSQQQQSKGLILDLRFNTGGLLNSVVDIAGMFLEKGSLVVETKNRDNKVIDRYVTTRTPIVDRSIPLFILVNNYTASAAEILAGVLQCYSSKDNKFLAFVVGTKTFGKGSVQEVIPVSNDCAIKLTIALYNLPNNFSIQGTGVTPDFEIDQKLPPSEDVKWFNRFFGRESNLKNTIKLDAKEKDKEKEQKNKKDAKQNSEKSWYERKRELISSDYMILSTVRLIEMLDLVQKAYPEKTKKRADILSLLVTLFNPGDSLDIEELKM